MKETACILILLAAISSPSHGEVFKCKLSSGEIVYQDKPCPAAATAQDKVEIIKMDPARQAEIEKQLADWKTGFAARETAELKARQQKQLEWELEMERQAAIDALNRNTQTQQELTEAIERNKSSSTFIPFPYPIRPYPYPPRPPYPYPPYSRPLPQPPPPPPIWQPMPPNPGPGNFRMPK